LGEYRKYIQDQNHRKYKKGKKYKTDRYLYYGTAILVLAAILCILKTSFGIGIMDWVPVNIEKIIESSTTDSGTDIWNVNVGIDEEIDRNADAEADKNTDEKADADSQNIRVLIETTGYAEITHPSVELWAEAGLSVTYGEGSAEADGESGGEGSAEADGEAGGEGSVETGGETGGEGNAEADGEAGGEGSVEVDSKTAGKVDGKGSDVGTSVTYAPDDAGFAQGCIRVQALDGGEVTIKSIERGYGAPSYAGVLELRSTAEGIVIINELPVESYLCKVVPSEMPATYELEALKAQAVCARSFVYRQMETYAYPEYEAHINDSTDYQVYGNSMPQESTDQAVTETAGQVVCYQGEVVTTYYYSTSCGKTTTVEAWGNEVNEQNAYLQSVELKDEDGDYERDLPWYRWEAEIPSDTLSDLIGLNTGVDIGELESLEITDTGPGGVVTQICAVGTAGEVTVDTENKIRSALGGTGYVICEQDGTEVESSKLLPSAFFTIEYADGVYILKGGGYGHGIGMSQNGANEMAKKGMDYQEILKIFFQGISIETKE
jgi:stage II sporulation protein D